MDQFWILLGFIAGGIAILRFFQKTNTVIAFREFFIMLYAINYLLSPAIIYSLPTELVEYAMKIVPGDYFPLALLGMGGLIAGTYSLKNSRLFTPNIKLTEIEAYLNATVLQQWVIGGIVSSLIATYFPGEIAFLIYLISLIRYVGAFGLISMDLKRYWPYTLGLFLYEFISALKYGMFHDFIMWVIFFLIYITFLIKLSTIRKIVFLGLGLIFFSTIQNSKSSYRAAVANGGGGISDFINTAKVSDISGEQDFFLSTDFIGSITRINQAWILASTVDNIDKTQNFQELENVKLYLEAALLPRVLAKNKLQSGNKEIFNKYSGHTISQGTSMGLGIFADGYIAYGTWGVLIFGYALGLLFAYVFKIVIKWTQISPIFFLFIFPILNYAVRPDCEVQTILGHIVKSVLVYGCIVWYYKSYFKKRYAVVKELHARGLISF